MSIISDTTRKSLFLTLKLHKSRLHLKTYTEEIKLIGNLHVNVQYHNQEANLVLIVVEGVFLDETGSNI